LAAADLGDLIGSANWGEEELRERHRRIEACVVSALNFSEGEFALDRNDIGGAHFCRRGYKPQAWQDRTAVATPAPSKFETEEELAAIPPDRAATLLKECRLIHGPRAAAALWRQLDLPPVPASAIDEEDEGRACLEHLLNTKVAIDDTGRTGVELIRDDFEAALEGRVDAQKSLNNDWLLLAVNHPHQGLFVPNYSVKAFHNTRWAQERHVRALRKLPTARPATMIVLGSETRGTFIPVSVVESIPASAI
jgi:hypothetical protein